MKPQLPPQEIWELLGEFLPSQVASLENSSAGKKILPMLEIDLWEEWELNIGDVWTDTSVGSDVLTWAVLSWAISGDLVEGVVETPGGIVITTQGVTKNQDF